MKVAIDSYCYHRYFGEIYPNLEEDPHARMSLSDFIKRAVAHGVEGVSIESFMLPDATPDGREDLRQLLDENGLERVWAWGHPRGLHLARSLRNSRTCATTSMSLTRSAPELCASVRGPEHPDTALGRASKAAAAPS